MTLREFTLKATPLAADEIYLASAADSYAERRVTLASLLTSQTLTTCTLASPTISAPTISGAITSSGAFNKVTITAPGTAATLTLADGSSLITSGAFAVTLSASAAVTLTLPATSATLARTDAAQTFSGTQTFGGTIAGAAITATSLSATGVLTALNATAIPAGGTTGSGVLVSSTANFGVFFGSGAPTLSAAKGSLYLRSDGSGTTDRAYINTNGSTTWTAVTTVA